MASGWEVSQYYRSQADKLGNLARSNRELLEHAKQADQAIGGELAGARRELAAVYLPALDDASLERAARLTGFQGFQRRDPRAALAQERKVLQSQLGKLEADERYQRRDLLIGDGGTLIQQLEDSMEALEPLQTECDRFEKQEGFAELLEVGYDTPNFKEHWWNAGYWRHWAAGDRICKALGMNDFGDDVIPAYRKYAEPRDVMRGDIARLQKEIEGVSELVRARDQAADRLAHLDEIYLQSAQDFLGEHLAAADPALLEQWSANEPDARAVQIGLRKLAGVQAKKQFIGEIAQVGIPQTIDTINDRAQKAAQKANKYAMPKWGGVSVPAPPADDKLAAMQAQNDKMRKRIDALVAARDYERFQLGNDPELWWWYFMESAPSRYYMPGLWGYYQRRPDVVVMTDPDDMFEPAPVAAAFVAAGDAERGGYLS